MPNARAIAAATLALCLGLFVASPALATQYIEDGSFEAGVGGGKWVEQDSSFGSPICTTADCGTGGGTTGPRTGTFWAWLGGGGGASHTVSLTQNFNLTGEQDGALSFFVWAGLFGTPAELVARVDSTTLFELDESNWTDYPSYTQIVVPTGRLTGGQHTLSFEYRALGPGSSTNISIDDVRLDAVPAEPLPKEVTVRINPVNIPAPPLMRTPPLETTLLEAKARKNGKASFKFTGSGGSGSLKFECQLDGRGFLPCRSTKRYTGLKPGRHNFQVRAMDAAGLVDLTPATAKVVVPKRPRR